MQKPFGACNAPSRPGARTKILTKRVTIVWLASGQETPAEARKNPAPPQLPDLCCLRKAS